MTCQTSQHYLVLRTAQYAEFFRATIFTYGTASRSHFDYLIFSPLIIKSIRSFSIVIHTEDAVPLLSTVLSTSCTRSSFTINISPTTGSVSTKYYFGRHSR